MGCLAKKIRVDPAASEYYKAIPYGRPLFARLIAPVKKGHTSDGVLGLVEASENITDTDHAVILARLVMTQYDDILADDLAIVSLLSSRVQLDSGSSPVVSEIVARGYAHLTYYRSWNVAGGYGCESESKCCTLPDPVIARLAMAMMEEEFVLSAAIQNYWTLTFTGLEKTAVVNTLHRLLVTGMCRPARGDLGEVLSSLHLLFCGDKLRHQKDKSFQTFSVPLVAWVRELTSTEKTVQPDVTVAGSRTLEVNFIQFCRNELLMRFSDYFSQEYLKHIYMSACITHCYDNCEAFDAVGAIRYTSSDGAEPEYLPLVVSMKTRAHIIDDYDICAATDAMIGALYGAGQERGLCLLVLLDQDQIFTTSDESGDGVGTEEVLSSSSASNTGETPSSSVTDMLESSAPAQQKNRDWPQIAKEAKDASVDAAGSQIVSKVIQIPKNDPFGITKLMRATKRLDLLSKVYCSHSALGYKKAEEGEEMLGTRGATRDPASSMHHLLPSAAYDPETTASGDIARPRTRAEQLGAIHVEPTGNVFDLVEDVWKMNQESSGTTETNESV